MPEDSNKVTIMVGDVETFQKFAPNVKLEHLKEVEFEGAPADLYTACLLYTSPSPRDGLLSRMPSSA